MLQREIDINAWQVSQLLRIAEDLPQVTFFTPSPGHGHPPAWIIGHLIIVGEIGQPLLGGRVAHPEWLRLFGRGSTDKLIPDESLSVSKLADILVTEYGKLRELAASIESKAILDAPHNNALFANTPVTTVGHLVALILTNHFGFHLAQLSCSRRSSGFAPLF
jgi:hypothetical protein